MTEQQQSKLVSAGVILSSCRRGANISLKAVTLSERGRKVAASVEELLEMERGRLADRQRIAVLAACYPMNLFHIHYLKRCLDMAFKLVAPGVKTQQFGRHRQTQPGLMTGRPSSWGTATA